MAELLPTIQAADIRRALTDYLATTFALADQDAQAALTDFILDPANGMFRGPYLRTRLPFTPSGEAPEYPWDTDDFAPYGHQSRAYTRLDTTNLSTARPRPEPTLVTTGTGSGKTESFLKPIVDHCQRMHAQGRTAGIKALILYPMNALANDQARRLTSILTSHDSLRGITAAKYTGEGTDTRTQVTQDGLITDRATIRDTPPDILLTNYKMLDQLLLRPADQKLWAESALTLRFLVLDEFHTYDGAQGTDVAMLIRRLGLALKHHWGDAAYTQDGIPLTDADRARPLGIVTPVATSATLGDDDSPSVITDFASTIFGETLGPDAVVTETRHTPETWLAGNPTPPASLDESMAARPVNATLTDSPVVRWLQDTTDPARYTSDFCDPAVLCRAVLDTLYNSVQAEPENTLDVNTLSDDEVGAALAAHPFTMELLTATAAPTTLKDLAHTTMPGIAEDAATAYLTAHLAALSHLRATQGRTWPSLEAHVWIRELTRINRAVTAAVKYEWHDDGTTSTQQLSLPAIYCRSCGRSGWAVELNPTGYDFTPDARAIRAASLTGSPRFRPLIYAPSAADIETTTGEPPEGLAWLNTIAHSIETTRPPSDDTAYLDGHILPVLTHLGLDAADHARQQRCPSCGRKDSIRFVGSASSTLMSVTLSTLFGSASIDDTDKKALMFTDSVQDAAHRAGFVAARSHTMTRRTIMRSALTETPASLADIVNRVIDDAGDDQFDRYRLVPPDFVHDKLFANYWQKPTTAGSTRSYRNRVHNRLLFDLALEIGLNTHFGRTLEQTGAVAVHIEVGSDEHVAELARTVFDRATSQESLLAPPTSASMVTWVHGILDHMRRQGGIHHPWLDSYIQADGNRWRIWGGRIKHEAMPAFPKGRSAPTFPRVGPGGGRDDSGLDPVTPHKSWYAQWTSRTLKVPEAHAAALAKELLAGLARDGILTEHTTDSKTLVYSIPAARVRLHATNDADLASGAHLLVCTDCRASRQGSRRIVQALTGAPCFSLACSGTLAATPRSTNYYRDLYSSGTARRLVAAEHTSVLPDAVRIRNEEGFKNSGTNPDAPNVLAATPTLEMGIDIGDLSTVFLASLPRTVASYVQRVGRAGRQTGNALNLAYVLGRGENLARLGEPSTLIGGAVRPPATYLSAEEILRRQFIAYLCDLVATAADAPTPRTASDVLSKANPGSYLGYVLARLADSPQDILDRFFATFHRTDVPTGAETPTSFVNDAAEQAIRAWATPGPDGTSELSTRIHTACATWAQRLENLTYRRKDIEQRIPTLQADAEAPAAIDDDKRAYHAAKSELALVRKTIQETTKDFWVSALEEHGLLPVYTLLGDDVHLDVSVTVIDPDTDQFTTESRTYKRASGSALSDFAPGSTFYVEGLAINIDSVDLGPTGRTIPQLLLCPCCGYHVQAPDALPQACPRCGSTGISDTSQVIPAIELTHVSAEVRRDEAHIGDTTDERKRTPYDIIGLADIDAARVRSSWYVASVGFGVKYLESVDLTWINVGKRGTSSLSRNIAGEPHSTPLFRVCEECGHLDGEAGSNHPRDHRPWCGNRRSSTEKTAAIALTRSLTTQGVLLRLPSHFTAGDPHALANLAAALRMGLTDHFGGDPGHLSIMYTPDPDGPAAGGNTGDALLLHDVVPGGSGYLTDIATPELLHTLLYNTWRRLDSCICQEENSQDNDGTVRLACHRCLLPHVMFPHEADVVSRVNAARHLKDLLIADTDLGPEETPPATMPWNTTTTFTPQASTESALEQHFRAALRETCEKLGASTTSEPGLTGDTDTIRLPGAARVYRLEPQVNLLGCRPDFLLRCSDANVPDVAIFTDGKAFHATPAHNRLADDMAKRETLREAGYFVLSITSADLDGHRPTTLDASLAQLPRMGTIAPITLTATSGTPLDWLSVWLRSPEPRDWEQVAASLPVANLATAQSTYHDDGRHLEQLAAHVLEGSQLTPSNEKQLWVWQHHHVVQLTRFKGITQSGAQFEHLIVLDDRDAALMTNTFDDSWKSFLAYRNAIQTNLTDVMFTTYSALAAKPASDSTLEEVMADNLPDSYASLLDQDASPAESALLRKIHTDAHLPAPVFSIEAGDGIPITFAWPQHRIGILIDPEPDDIAELSADGWTVVDAADNDALTRLTHLMENAS